MPGAIDQATQCQQLILTFIKGNKMITKKVAVFEYVAGGDMACMAGVQFASDHNRTDANVIRVSEWMDVEFTEREEEKENIQDRLNLIAESTRKCLEEATLIKAKLTELRRQKRELELLTGDVL